MTNEVTKGSQGDQVLKESLESLVLMAIRGQRVTKDVLDQLELKESKEVLACWVIQDYKVIKE